MKSPSLRPSSSLPSHPQKFMCGNNRQGRKSISQMSPSQGPSVPLPVPNWAISKGRCNLTSYHQRQAAAPGRWVGLGALLPPGLYFQHLKEPVSPQLERECHLHPMPDATQPPLRERDLESKELLTWASVSPNLMSDKASPTAPQNWRYSLPGQPDKTWGHIPAGKGEATGGLRRERGLGD